MPTLHMTWKIQNIHDAAAQKRTLSNISSIRYWLRLLKIPLRINSGKEGAPKAGFLGSVVSSEVLLVVLLVVGAWSILWFEINERTHAVPQHGALSCLIRPLLILLLKNDKKDGQWDESHRVFRSGIQHNEQRVTDSSDESGVRPTRVRGPKVRGDTLWGKICFRDFCWDCIG